MQSWGEMPAVNTDKLREILKRLERSRADQEAWNLLYRHLWPLLVAINYRILRGDRELAQDASQEVVLRLFRYVQFEDFQDKPEDFLSYVRAMCRNVSRSYLARLLREPSFSQQLLESRELLKSPTGENDAEERAILRSEMTAATASLDSDDRKLLDLLRAGATISEIAERLGITYSNAAVRIHRLRLALSKSMKTG